MARRSQVSKEEDMIDRIDKIKTFVLDMDGTIYNGNTLFPFTIAFLDKMKEFAEKVKRSLTGKAILINWKKWRLRSNRNR